MTSRMEIAQVRLDSFNTPKFSESEFTNSANPRKGIFSGTEMTAEFRSEKLLIGKESVLDELPENEGPGLLTIRTTKEGSVYMNNYFFEALAIDYKASLVKVLKNERL